MIPIWNADHRHLGLIADLSATKHDTWGFVHGDVICRVSHESGLRRGTYLGLAHFSKPELSRWGTFFTSFADPATVAGVPDQPDLGPFNGGIPAGLLTFDDLSTISGFSWTPLRRNGHAAPGDERWFLQAVDRDVSWDGSHCTTLVYQDLTMDRWSTRQEHRLALHPDDLVLSSPYVTPEAGRS